jgi:hypothetical protein|tara:strand:- start:1915 stop:2205 length:291 start_codon:yes stop_codon:yes gene_type:complete
MIKTLSGIHYPMLDTMQMHNRREEKRAELRHEQQVQTDEHYRIKRQDYYDRKTQLEHYNFKKDIEEINQYLSLKRNLEYYEYRYGIYLGNNLDVFI